MRSLTDGSFLAAVTRRLAAVAVCALFALGASLGLAPGGKADSAPPSVPPPPASPAAVTRALGVHDVPAEIVILVDISLSMAPGYNDLYSTVRQKVLSYLAVLAQQDPQDLVGVIAFGKPSDNQVTDPGPPSRNIWLPTAPYSQDTDFGWAFQQAVQMLRGAPPDIKAGAVLLLSDGELSVAPGVDPVYGTGFTGPGWAKLRAQVEKLSARIPITGYDVPLTDDTTYTGNQYGALKQVFQPVQSLPSGTTDLSNAFSLATQGILDSEVAKAAAPDIGKGFQVAWSGLRGAGAKPLNLGTGQAEVTLTVRATTQKVPLYLSEVSVVSAGLPVTMRGSLPGGYLLVAGQSASWNVRLTWDPRSAKVTRLGGSWTAHGKLALHATVSSPFTPTLGATFGDTAFSVGGIQDGISPVFPATEPARYDIGLIVVVLLIAAALIALICAAAARARLTGQLAVTPAAGPTKPIPLRGWYKSTRIDGLLGKPGRLSVHGSALRRRMRVTIRVPGRRPFKETLLPGKSALPGGIAVVHQVRAHGARPEDLSRRPEDLSKERQ